jgi:hypothetical protein
MQRFSWLTIFLLFTLFAVSQAQFTPCDNLPGIIKSYKPSFSDDLPDWAKMLYKDEVNFDLVNLEFVRYMNLHPGEKSPIIRYFKIWRRAVESYVLSDGTIQLPDMEHYEQKLFESQLSAGKDKNHLPLTNSDWTFLGPKETFWLNESGSSTTPLSCPWQVNVYSFDVAGSNNNVIYCGTETGFVNKSTDKGLT